MSESGGTRSRIQNALGGLANGLDELGRFNDGSAAAPAQDPSLDFSQARKLQTHLDAAVLLFAQLLRGMPALFADIVRGERIEPQDDFELAASGMDPEAVAEDFLDGKLRWPGEGNAGELNRLNPRGDKGAQVLTKM